MKVLCKILLFLSLLFSAGNIFAQQNKDAKDLAGIYTYSTGFVGAGYFIKADGNYEYSSWSDCCDPVWKEVGNYSVNETGIHFKFLKHTLNTYNLLDPAEMTKAYRKLYDYKGDDFTAEDIETEYDMQIVRWDERVYLITPEKRHLFAAAVNLKIEPRPGIINENYLTSRFFLRRGDEVKKVTGKPSVPAELLALMPNPPINIAVTKIEEQDKERIIIVNKGSKDGLKIGMCFIGKNVEPDYDNLLWVISIEENSAKLKDFKIFRSVDYHVGDVLSTESTYKK